MRVDPAAAAALQSQLLGLLKGPAEAQRPGFRADAPAPAAPAASPPSAAVAVPTASLAMLVAAAAAAAPAVRPVALRKAERGIGALERLHRLVGSGALPDSALDELADWRTGEGVGDGEVGTLLEEIEMRILVELAKAGR